MSKESITNKDLAISSVRMTAMCSIVLCHMMQYYGMELAYWFNVGVQIFLCISGYLYGKRAFEGNVITFYKKMFGKILLEYYVVILITIITYYFLAREFLSFSKIIGMLTLSETISGMGHLWYIAPLLLCYILIPVYSQYFDYMKEKTKGCMIPLILLLVVNYFAFGKIFTFYSSAVMNCFVLGFFFGRVVKEAVFRRYMQYLVYVIAIAMNAVQILHDYVTDFSWPGIFERFYWDFTSYAHVALGVALFLLLHQVFALIKGNRLLGKMCKLSDKYSYEVYLVHHMFILTPFSIMGLTEYKAVNILLVLVCVCVAAYLLKKCCGYIRAFLKCVQIH